MILQTSITSIDQAEALATRVLNALSGTDDLNGFESLLAEASELRLPKAALTLTSFCKTPTWRCIKRNPRAEAPGAGLRTKWKSVRKLAEISKLICEMRYENNALELYYQPLFNPKSKRIRPVRRCCGGLTVSAE